jgi:hypothetical protein
VGVSLSSYKRGTRNQDRKKHMDILHQLIDAFTHKGWLNQAIRIRLHDREYRIFCSEREFLAYRINEHCGIGHGFPGWIVCAVTNDKVIDDSMMSHFESTEPSAHEWLHCIADDDSELM